MPKPVNEVFRDFVRWTGDGLPNEPVGHPLPIGDPRTGVHNPTKADLRDALGGVYDAAEGVLEARDQVLEAAVDVHGATLFAGSIPSLIADTEPSYPTGTVFMTRREGASLEVVAPADAHMTTVGGVPLYVRPKDGMLPMEHFGVTASTGDASAQLLMAVQESILQKAKVVLPAFDMHLEAPVTLSMTGDFQNGGISIQGGGSGQSRIIVDGASNPAGAILLDSPSSRGARFFLQGFSVLADGTVPGPPIKATMLPGGSRPNSSMVLRDIECQGLLGASAVVNDTDYFTAGIDVSGQWRARLLNVLCCGIRGTAGDDYTSGSTSWLMSECLKADACYDIGIDFCRFADAITGIRSLDGVGGSPSDVTAEVFRCYRSQIDMVQVGIDHYRPGIEPQFVVADTYIHYRNAGVRVKGVRIGSISGCMIDQKDTGQNSPIVPADISLEFIQDFDVYRNTANFDGDSRRRQVQILDTDATVGRVTQNIKVSDNRATGTLAAVVFKGADTGRVDYTPGDISRATVTAHVTDNSSNKLNLVIPKPYSARVRRLAVQSIGSAAYSAISFDTLISQDFADTWSAGAPATINVPDGQGISKARIRAYAIYATATSGRRELRLMKNGSVVTMGFHAVQAPIDGVPTRINVASEWLDVVASDSFTIEAYQDRGSPLDVTAYVEVEFR